MTADERARLDETRRDLGLSKEASERVEARLPPSALPRGPAPVPLLACPHCGELYTAEVEKPEPIAPSSERT